MNNDNFVVTWTSTGQDGSDQGVFGQFFTGNGSKIGNEFQINTYTDNAQSWPTVASLRNGNFVVIWQSSGQDSTNTLGIFGQLFAGNRSKIGNEFQVNSYKTKDQKDPSVASFSNGNFIVVWTSTGQDNAGSEGVFGQLFDGNTAPIGNEFQVNTYVTKDQDFPSVASFSNGNFVVTWNNNNSPISHLGAYGQLFDRNAIPIGNEFQLNIRTAASSLTRSSATSLNNGNFVVTWESWFQDGSYYGIYGQLFNAIPITSSTAISTTFTTFTTSTSTFPSSTRFISLPSSSTLSSPVTSTTLTTSATSTSTFLRSTLLISLPSSSTLSSLTTSTTFSTSATSITTSTRSNRLTNPITSTPPAISTIPKASSPKRTRLVTSISLGVGGLVCFCLAPLGFFLLRKRKSQTGARLSEETDCSSTAFELKPVVQRGHKIIGETYYQLSTLVREEAEEIYLQTGHLIPFPGGQKKVTHVIGSGQFGKIKVAQRIGAMKK